MGEASMQSQQSYAGPGWTLGDIWAAVLRKWVTALALFATTVVACGVLGALWPKSYEGTALIAVSPLAADPTRDIEVNIDTEAVIVTSRRVITAAAAKLGVNTKELQDRTAVSIPTDSNALQVTVTSSSPSKAAAEANAVANAYLGYRANESEALVRKYVREGIDTQIDSLLESLPSDSTSGDRSMVQRRVAALREKKSQVIASAPGPGEVVSRATPPSGPSSPGMTIFLGTGIVLAALVGVAGALLHDRLDPRVRSAKLLARHVPCQVLDAAGRSRAQFREHVVFALRAIRREASSGDSTPTAFVAVDGPSASELVEDLRRAPSTEGTGPLVLVPEAGTVGVARAVATTPPDAVFVLVCRASDHFDRVMEPVSALEQWNRVPSLVVMLGAEAEADQSPVAEDVATVANGTPSKAPSPAQGNGKPAGAQGNGKRPGVQGNGQGRGPQVVRPKAAGSSREKRSGA